MTSYIQDNMAGFRMSDLAEKSHFFLSQWLKGRLNSADVFVNIKEKTPGDCLNISGFELCSKGEDKTWTRGPWTPLLDRVHAPLFGPVPWTGSMDPLFSYLEKKHQIKNKAILKLLIFERKSV